MTRKASLGRKPVEVAEVATNAIPDLVGALGADVSAIHSHWDVVPAVIDFANGTRSPALQTRMSAVYDQPSRYYQLAPDDGRASYINMDESDVDEGTARQNAARRIEEERRFAVLALDHAAQGLTPLTNWLRKNKMERRHFRERYLQITLSPEVRYTKGRAKIVWHLAGPSHRSREWILFAAAWLADEAQGEQTDVGRCQLESCGRFFLIDWHAGNRPRTKYCSQEHRLENNALGATKRKQESRDAKNARKHK